MIILLIIKNFFTLITNSDNTIAETSFKVSNLVALQVTNNTNTKIPQNRSRVVKYGVDVTSFENYVI